ncbi:MAG: 3-dehydroquinate synthase [Clostridia bacterium]|nr:3-dehydroquinate synthase [Clostridia bacterium]
MILSVSGEYDIILEKGALAKVGEYLDLDRRVLVVTDSGVPAAYAEAVAAACREAHTVVLPQGEASKNLDSFALLLREMVASAFTRRDCVVAVGGGVVGDLSGFAAACYMRGIDFYNIPTTLLSQVDSSIGGKTAIDFEGVKNIVGAFYKPRRVLIDPDTLKTLDKRQLHAGLAEAIKMATTFDESLFSLIEKSESLEDDLPVIIEQSLRIKKAVVEEDFKEAGLRRALNFGHTVGHAIEAYANGALLHGECVALGMTYAASPAVLRRLIPLLEKYALPVKTDASPEALLPYLVRDKKMDKAGVIAVFAEELGSFVFKTVSPEALLSIK